MAGAHHASERIAQVVEQTGLDAFLASLAAIRDLSEIQMRSRIAAIADGTYRATSWTEYHREFYKIPCTLTVAGDRMTFDFEGWSRRRFTHMAMASPMAVPSGMVPVFTRSSPWLNQS